MEQAFTLSILHPIISLSKETFLDIVSLNAEYSGNSKPFIMFHGSFRLVAYLFVEGGLIKPYDIICSCSALMEKKTKSLLPKAKVIPGMSLI